MDLPSVLRLTSACRGRLSTKKRGGLGQILMKFRWLSGFLTERSLAACLEAAR